MRGWERCEGLEIPFGDGDQAVYSKGRHSAGPESGDLLAASACQSHTDPTMAALGKSPRWFTTLSWRVPGSGIRRKG